MSVADVLKQMGKPVESSEFVRIVAEKFNVTERHAYRLTKKALENREIRRHVREDRTVLYLLPDWRYSKLEEKVKAALEELSRYDCSEVSLEDLAYEVAATPEEIRDFAYRHGPKYGIKIGPETIRSVGRFSPRRYRSFLPRILQNAKVKKKD